MIWHKKRAWFTPARNSYLPANNIGAIIYLAYATYVVAIGIIWLVYERTAWTLVTQAVPLAVGAMLLTQYIASKHSK